MDTDRSEADQQQDQFASDANKSHHVVDLPKPTGVVTMKELDSDSDSESGSGKKKKKKKKGKKQEPEVQPVSIGKLFSYATGWDLVLIFVGILAAMGAGVSMPILIVLYGDLTNAFVQNSYDVSEVCNRVPACCTNGTLSLNNTLCILPDELSDLLQSRDLGEEIGLDPITDFMDEIERFAIGAAIIGLINFVLGYVFVTCLNFSAERQVHRIRILFLQSILKQDIGWYDTNQTNDFASKMAEDLTKIQEGIGEKIGMFVFFMTVFIASLINAFIHGWELTLVIMSVTPVLIASAAIIAKSQTALTAREVSSYSKAGALAEEVLSAIRTVVAFGGQEKEVERYENTLVFSRKANIMGSLITGIGGGLMWFIIYASYGLAFWYGVKLIMDDREHCFDDPFDCHVDYDPSKLLIVFFSVMMGAMNVGQSTPYVEAFGIARGSAAKVYEVIERQPPIDSSSKEGKKPTRGGGNITFRDVHFNYPSRKDVKILQGLNLSINKGETVALVGPSGCGKSTVIQLIQRFYDPDAGRVELEGEDIRELNLGAMRDIIGIVGQEPVLFDCSIGDNIRMGRENITEDEMIAATKEANAYNFIMKLPMKFNTMVGERGAQLSGGQKQRIAIARALVRNPEVLLLDEATSALDTQSEAIVQSALDKASSGRTTVVVAHRLSTIRQADKIVAIKAGQVYETGTHEELMKAKGLYHSLVTAQMTEEDEEELDPAIAEEKRKEEEEAYNKQVNTKVLAREESVVSRASFERGVSVMSVGSGRGSISSDGVPYKKMQRNWMDKFRLFGKDKHNPDDIDDLPQVSIKRILKVNSTEWKALTIGCMASVIMGASMPAYAILFGEVLGILSHEIDEARDESKMFAGVFVAVGFAVGCAMLLQAYSFGIAGAHLTNRFRKLAFEAMLKQEMGWFDSPKNSTGALCSRLSADAAAVQGTTGTRLGTILQSIFTLVISIALAIYYQWKLGLVTLLFTPLVLAAIYFQTMILMGADTVEKKALEKSSKLAVEAISNIRTVAGLRKEEYFVNAYTKELALPRVKSQRNSHIRGAVFGFAQSMPFFAYATCMYYGGVLVENEDLEYEKVFKVAQALILGTMIVGQATAFAPNYNEGKIAAARIFRLLDRKPKIDSTGQSGLRINNIAGNIEFKHSQFRYPTRRQVKVLRDLNLSMRSGQTIALVGPSGCGKSTCIQLLQRFYNLESGALNLEGQNIEGLNVPHVRSHIGIVSQEPTLFDRTLAENIAYGDNSRTVSMDEVIDAAKRANIHNFIAGLPQGYETRTGDKGTQLSGGQKQRVAIARALVRNPKILLLDEATSALDTESEKVVQEALDVAAEGRTTISIAHRLSTIQNVNRIFVINHGMVAESGTHSELVAQGGIYHKLWTRQAGGVKKKTQ